LFKVDLGATALAVLAGIYVATKFGRAGSVSTKVFKRPLFNWGLFGAARIY
jgi:hypothetical protein